jgi:hypothetical protein
MVIFGSDNRIAHYSFENPRSPRLNNLGNKLGLPYERTGKIADLEEAIQAARKAVESTPDDHPSLAGWLTNV